jgi:hypothetical protein
MPKIRDLLVHVSVEAAKGKRKCHRTRTRTIEKGERCLVVKSGPMNAPYSYSSENAKQMLDGGWQKLCRLYAELDLDPPWQA